jgi:hypothetical protein
MKKFKLMMMAAFLAFAGTAMAQDAKKVVLYADKIDVANGEDATICVKIFYEGNDVLCGANFSLELPEGLLLKGFNTKEAQDAAKASALKKACELDEDAGVWGEDGDMGWVSVKQKADGNLLFVIIDQDDKTEFENILGGVLVNINVHAVADVKGQGKITGIGITNTENVSVLLGQIADFSFGVNEANATTLPEVIVGINDIKSSEATAPAYNLQGIRVNNAKGLIIRDGKKMVVK